MMLPLLLAAAVPQTVAPTVGDTVWLRYELAVPAGRSVRPADWEPADPVELLGPPRVVPRGGSVEVVYAVVVWRAGEHRVDVPGPLLLGANGGVDSLPAKPVTVRVASVLPAARPDTGLRPQPRAEFVARGATTPWPPVLALAAAALLLAPLHWWWRRRGRPLPLARADAGGPASPPLERWSDAGEARAVAAAVSGRLRTLLERRMDGAPPGLDTDELLARVADARADWPHGELGDLLRALDEARFGHPTFPDAIGLARWAGELESRLRQEAAA